MYLDGSFVGCAFLISFIAFVFFIGRSAKASTRKSVTALAESRCPFCDAEYGFSVATATHEQHIRHCQEERKANPHLKINFGPHWSVQCPRCRKEFTFDSDGNKMIVSVDLSLHKLSGEIWQPPQQFPALDSMGKDQRRNGRRRNHPQTADQQNKQK